MLHSEYHYIDLQRFADGGAGGAGSGDGAANTSTGVTAPDAGEQELHKPRTSRQQERAKRRQQRVSQSGDAVANAPMAGSAAPGTQDPAGVTADPVADPQTKDTAAGGQQEGQDLQQTAKKVSFDEILQDPEHKRAFDQRVNDMFRQRFRDDEARAERDSEVQQLMHTVAQMIGQKIEDPSELDPAKLRQALLDNSAILDAVALEAGQDSGRYRSELEMRTQNAAMKAQLDQQRKSRQAMEQEQRNRQAFMELQQEAQRLKTIYPQLDLNQMLQDPQTMRTVQALQIAGARDPVRTVYEAAHRNEIYGGLAAKAAQQGMTKVANAVAANSRRPLENGQQGQGGIQTVLDPRNLTKEQRRDIRRRVAAGEKVSF